MSGGLVRIVVPTKFGQGDGEAEKTFYTLPVTYRGEMYHLRAAMAVEPKPLILLEHTDEARKNPQVEQLVDYLASIAHHTKQDVFLTPWNKQKMTELTAGEKIKDSDAKGCQVWYSEEPKRQLLEDPDKFTRQLASLLIEFKATEIIAKHASRIADITTAMAEVDIPKDHKAEVLKKFANLEKQDADHRVFPEAPNDAEHRVLVLHRDSGKRSGVYPEYDSGHALSQLLALITKIGNENTRKLSPIICGDAQSDTYPSTGAYWTKLAALNKDPTIPQRSFEAYYLQWAYKQNYFKMVVGFRSGVLDLFTFLGIPTVSIGLRNGVGEVRHSWIATPDALQRLNVQYDLPRHKTTAWRKFREPKPPQDVGALLESLDSPYWKSEPPAEVVARPKKTALTPEQMEEMLTEEPQGFEGFDRAIIYLGLQVASARFLGTKLNMKRLPGGSYKNVVTAEDIRRSIPTDWNIVDKFVQDHKEHDKAELDLRKKRQQNLQESDTVWGLYKGESEKQWKR